MKNMTRKIKIKSTATGNLEKYFQLSLDGAAGREKIASAGVRYVRERVREPGWCYFNCGRPGHICDKFRLPSRARFLCYCGHEELCHGIPRR